MKFTKKIAALIFVCVLCAGSVWAAKVYFECSGSVGEQEFTIPDELEELVNQYHDEIQQTITESEISKDDIQNAINDASEMLKTVGGMYTTIDTGVDEIAKDILRSVPGAQIGQNQWAQAWIGSLLPKFNMGGGINASIATVAAKPIKTLLSTFSEDAANAITMDVFPLPAITGDIRVGGIILPFDVGFSLMVLDTSKLSFGQSWPFNISYLTLGGDIRYALIKNSLFNFRLSVSAGYYYTRFGFGYKDENINNASVVLGSSTFVAGAQASVKLLKLIVPFAGARLMLSNGNLDWAISPKWDDDNIAKVFPATISGGTKTTAFIPQVYVGLGLDLFVVDITASVGYSFVANSLNAALSLRIAWN